MAGKTLKERQRKAVIEIVKNTKRHDKSQGAKTLGHYYEYDIYIDPVKITSKNELRIDIQMLKKYGPKKRFAIMRYCYASIIYASYKMAEDPSTMLKLMGSMFGNEDAPSEVSLDVLSINDVKELLFSLTISDFGNTVKWVYLYEQFFKLLIEFKKQLIVINDLTDEWININKQEVINGQKSSLI